MPMPDMNPEITEYGVKATRRPILETPQQNLDESRHNDDGERVRQVVCVQCNNDRHRHGHRARGPRDLRPGAA